MFFRFFLFLGFFILSSVGLASKEADALHGYLSSMKTFQADFQQKILDSKGRLKQVSAGKFFLKKPKQFVWEVDKPHAQKLVSNGKVLWVYQKALKQASSKSVGSVFQKTPIELLSGSSRDFAYYFQVKMAQEGKTTAFYLEPKDKKKAAFKLVQLVFENGRLKRLSFSDMLNQRVEVYFSRVRENIPLSSALFEFSPPKGVDVIRHK